jgi:glycosyltransferase involved in cell wall biosynthesis
MSNVMINLLAYRPSGTGLSRYADLLLQRWPNPQNIERGPLQLRLGKNGRAELCNSNCSPLQKLTKTQQLLQAADLLQHSKSVTKLIKQSAPSIIYAPFTQFLRDIPYIPQVVTCHDLTPLHYPNSCRAYLHSRLVIMGHLHRANHIIAISQSVADSLNRAGIKSQRISVIPNGVEKCEKPISEPASRDVLLIARHARNKNVELAIQGFAKFLRLRREWDGRLIVIGRPDRKTKAIIQLVREYDLATRIIFKKEVSDEELDQHFHQCFCLLSTSLMEGFDYPLFEAQARGLPTLASDIDVHREFHDGTSIMFRCDDDGTDLAIALQTIASDSKTWLDLSQRGLINANRHSLTRQISSIQTLLNEKK